MKRFAHLVAALALALAASTAPAQAAISVPLAVTFVLPTTACTAINGVPVVPCDNIPLTGANALTSTDIWLSLTPIPNGFSGPPTLSIPPASTSTTTNFNASSGDTIYVRLKARNASASSAFSVEATKTVTVGSVPNNITSVTLTINLS